MNNFIFENKTKVYFGKGGVKEYLGSLLVNYSRADTRRYSCTRRIFRCRRKPLSDSAFLCRTRCPDATPVK